MVTQREKRNDLCIQTTDSSSWIALDGAVGPLGTPLFVKMIGFSRQVGSGTTWMFLSQPKPQDSETFRTDTCTDMSPLLLTDGNMEMKHIYLKFTILSFQPSQTQNANPPLRSVTYYPIATVGCHYN
jgi:hypothetical protein